MDALAVTDAALPPGADRTVTVGGTEVRMRRDDDGGVTAFGKKDGAELVVRTAFWFAWSGFYPRTSVID